MRTAVGLNWIRRWNKKKKKAFMCQDTVSWKEGWVDNENEYLTFLRLQEKVVEKLINWNKSLKCKPLHKILAFKYVDFVSK